MALYKYDKAVLPKIPDVDSEYPYAAILNRNMDYYLYLTDKKGQYNSGTNEWVFLAGTTLKAHELNSGMWMLEDTMTLPSDTALPASVFTGIWANYDIVHTSDSSQVKFAGSEAEVYFPKIYRYGDVLLPEVINGYPVEGYNHTIIVAFPGENNIEYALIATTTQCYAATTGSGSVILAESDLEASSLIAQFNPQTGAWEWVTDMPLHEAGFDLSTYDILWTSTGILNGSADSTEVYFAASEPPVYGLKYYHYNDVFASELPFGYPNEYPYAYIMNMPQSNAAAITVLILSKSTFYIEVVGDTRKSFVSVNSTAESVAYFLGSEINLWNTYAAGKASQLHCDVVVAEGSTELPVTLLWANVNVPLGSADSTTWYLEASEPVLVGQEEEEEKVYAIMGSTMTAIGNQARRLGGTNAKLTPTEMISKLSSVDLVGVANLLGGCTSSSTADIKSQEQSLIDTANAATGGTATDLTTAQNALIEGYGSGGVENGYEITFCDENSEELAFYSIKQGHSINPPIYDCKAWETTDGTVVSFPYTPTGDLVVYANNDTIASQLYSYFNVDPVEYPYLIIVSNFNNHISMYFGKTLRKNTTTSLELGTVRYGYKITADHKNMDKSDLNSVVEFAMSTFTSLSTDSSYGMNSGNGWYHYTNFDSNLTDGTITYRLD